MWKWSITAQWALDKLVGALISSESTQKWCELEKTRNLRLPTHFRLLTGGCPNLSVSPYVIAGKAEVSPEGHHTSFRNHPGRWKNCLHGASVSPCLYLNPNRIFIFHLTILLQLREKVSETSNQLRHRKQAGKLLTGFELLTIFKNHLKE